MIDDAAVAVVRDIQMYAAGAATKGVVGINEHGNWWSEDSPGVGEWRHWSGRVVVPNGETLNCLLVNGEGTLIVSGYLLD